MSEIVFLVEDAPEGGFPARALDASFFAEAETLDALGEAVRDVACQYDDADRPRLVRLHFVRDEVITFPATSAARPRRPCGCPR